MTSSKNIRVLHIASGDLWAGAEVQLYNLIKSLHRMSDVTAEVILLNHGRLEQELRNIGINVTVFDETQMNGIKILFQLINTISHTKPDIVHTHRNKENILGSIAARFSGNIPTLRTAHGAPEHSPAWYHIPKRIIILLDWFCGRFLQKKIVAVSEDLAGILAKSYPSEKILVIHNGIDIKQVSQLAGSAKIQSDKLKIGIIGRLVPIKRVDLFICAAHKLLGEQHKLNLSFHIFGDGPLQHELETLNRQFETHAHIHFEGHSHSIHTELRNLDVLLMTSDHEGLPMTLLEAMVLKTPILAHAVGGIPSLLDHGACGILIESHNPEGYAQAIVKLVREPSLRNTITDNAFARVNEHYSAVMNANAYLRHYNNLVSA